VRSSGGVDCWGINYYGQLGVGGDLGPESCGGYPCSPRPISVTEITQATQVATGHNHSCARLLTGNVDCWGEDNRGQLGLSPNTVVEACGQGEPCSTTPLQVPGITNAAQVAAGDLHSCALLSTGQVDCWGYSTLGQLGDGTTSGPECGGVCRAAPAPVTGIANATQIAAGDHDACAVLSTGHVACWGSNRSGQLGAGSSAGPESCGGDPCSTTPVEVSAVTTATQVATSADHSCALLSTGRVTCWGANQFGQLGDGTTTGPDTCRDGVPCRTIPVQVSGITDAVQVATGGGWTCALLSSGQIDCWGNSGQLGSGPGPMPGCGGGCSATPVHVSGMTNATQVAANWAHSCARLSTGQVMCWGDGGYGKLGDGSSASSNVPVLVSGIP
jgi:alpha-tubulin suppressor-like RCC1 family protein